MVFDSLWSIKMMKLWVGIYVVSDFLLLGCLSLKTEKSNRTKPFNFGSIQFGCLAWQKSIGCWNVKTNQFGLVGIFSKSIANRIANTLSITHQFLFKGALFSLPLPHPKGTMEETWSTCTRKKTLAKLPN